MSVSISSLRDLITDTAHTRWVAPFILAAEAALCGLIVWKIPCA